ncbi:MAG: Fic family protein [Rhodospirillaceae bacterium]|nr:Fic family protein [Rhodospirillaceae bacterium]
MVVPYSAPESWLRYDPLAVIQELTEAKAAVMSLAAMPYQRAWADRLQAIELKREVAGTSRIEGADFTERELDEALRTGTPDDRLTRSQRQARAAKRAYEWIATVPADRPIDDDIVRQVHRLIVTGCDDDHCAPGILRGSGQNVIYGRPRHRGVEGGGECATLFKGLMIALGNEFRAHDPLIQALALHYHLGAMHPFMDGNGRTARALEALMLRRVQLKDTLFIAMSNYYYDEKERYLDTLSAVRANNYDLTPFLKFGLRGIAQQCGRLMREIRTQVSKSLFRDVMRQMYSRLESTRKRALAVRQVAILEKLLQLDDEIEFMKLWDEMADLYDDLKAPERAFYRDLDYLEGLKAIYIRTDAGVRPTAWFSIRLEWATEITETAFFREISRLPEAKSRFLSLRIR